MKFKNILPLLLSVSCIAFAETKSTSKKAASVSQKSEKQAAKNTFTINRILVSICTEEDYAIITQLELERPTLQGEARTLEDMIFEKLVFLDAKVHKVLPDEEAIDRHLQTVQRENNLTLDQLKAIFKSAGYSYEEGREQFAIMSTVSSMLDYKIRSRLVVPERDVIAYYNENPEMEEARYYIETAFVPLDTDVSAQDLKEKLRLYAKGQGSFSGIVWSKPFWINKSDLADDKQFVTALKRGQISQPYEIVNGFELYRLKDAVQERPKPLDDRYKEISAALRRPRYEQLLAEYKKELFDNASIIYF